MKKKYVLFAMLAVFVTIAFIAINKAKPNEKNIKNVNKSNCPSNCNVIVISIDTLRADHLGIYGYQKPTTPNIDKFSQNAIIFEKAFAQSSWTLPSHAAMLTGRYPQKLDVEVLSDRLPQGSTITEILKNNNYQTAAFTGGAFVDEQHGFSQGFDTFEEIQNWQDAEILTQKATSWLTSNQKNKFFLFLHYFHVHDPYSPKADSAGLIDPNYKGNLKSFDISQIVKLNKGEITLPQSDLEHLKTLYDAELLEMDKELGKIFELLSETKLIDNSIIIITSDHGEEFGEHGTWAMHAYSLYDELIHIPLIIRIPDFNQVKRNANLAELVDIPKTIISLLNIKSPQELDGINLMDSFDGKTSKKYVYSETSSQKQQLLDNIERLTSNQKINEIPPQILEGLNQQKKQKIKTHMVRTDNFKLIKNFDNTMELYNLKDDPFEKNNIYGTGIGEEKTLIDALNNY